jgi:hypothetical protein
MARRGRRAFVEVERVRGVVGGGGGEGILESLRSVCFGNWDVASGPGMEGEKSSGGGSTCCAVELKYRARLGRRNVGGSAEDGIRVSRTDRRRLLLSIVRVDIFGVEQLLEM